MESPLLHEQSPAAYFKELLDSALARQHVTAGDLTAYYLVNLLCQFVRADACESFGRDAEPLALKLTRALGQGGSAQRAQLRNLGDVSLFVSGYFADSFPRRAVDIDYYVSMGEYAYGSLSRQDRDAFAEVFGELSRKFVGFTGCAVGRQRAHRCGSAATTRCGSTRSGCGRAAPGMVSGCSTAAFLPNASIGKRFIQ